MNICSFGPKNVPYVNWHNNIVMISLAPKDIITWGTILHLV